MNPALARHGFETFGKCNVTDNLVEAGDNALGPSAIKQIIDGPGGIAIISERLACEHLGAIAAPARNHTEGFYIFEGASNSWPADAEFTGQLFFAGQIFPHPIFTCGNALGELV